MLSACTLLHLIVTRDPVLEEGNRIAQLGAVFTQLFRAE
jgi:hypothetical protein